MESQAPLQQTRRNNTFALLGVLLLVPALLVWGIWIQTFSSNPSASQAEKVEIFLSYFPKFLQTVRSTSYLVLISCVLAILISAIGLTRANILFKVLSIIVIIIGSLVTMLQLFTMM